MKSIRFLSLSILLVMVTVLMAGCFGTKMFIEADEKDIEYVAVQELKYIVKQNTVLNNKYTTSVVAEVMLTNKSDWQPIYDICKNFKKEDESRKMNALDDASTTYNAYKYRVVFFDGENKYDLYFRTSTQSSNNAVYFDGSKIFEVYYNYVGETIGLLSNV